MTSPRKIVALSVCLAMSLVAVACSSDGDAADSSSSSTVSSTVDASSTSADASSSTVPDVATTTIAPTTTTIAPTTTTTTVPPTTTIPPTTTTIPPPGASLPLRFDGVGDVRFGADADSAIYVVASVLGGPTDDSGWIDAVSLTCPGTEVRLVSWGDLTMYFGDESTVSSGRRHFFHWSFGPPAGIEIVPKGMKTPEGIGFGSSVAEIRAAYPLVTIFGGDELASASALLRDDLFAFLSDTADEGRVTALLGGQGCGE